MLETGLSMSQFMTAIAIADVNIRELRQRVPFCGPLVEVQEYWSTSPGRRADSHVATAHESSLDPLRAVLRNLVEAQPAQGSWQ
jgi:hypothetical protein